MAVVFSSICTIVNWPSVFLARNNTFITLLLVLVQLYAENCIHLLSSLTGDASQFHAVTKKRDLNIVRTFRQYFHFLSWHLWVLVFCIKAWYQVYYFSVQYVAGNVFKFHQNNAEFIDVFCITYILGKFQPNFWGSESYVLWRTATAGCFGSAALLSLTTVTLYYNLPSSQIEH